MRFHLTPRNAELRRIQYQSNAKSLLTLIDEELKTAVSRTFSSHGVARLTAFYLQQHLAYEDEIRLLVSNPPPTSKFKSGPDDYIAIDIGQERHHLRPSRRCAARPTARAMLRL